VTHAAVAVDGASVGAIDRGLLVLLGFDRDDDRAAVDRMLYRLLTYRIFPDSQGRMNASVAEVGGGVLLISQFTLAADTGKGRRPSFTSAMPPAEAQPLYDYALSELGRLHPQVAAGVFGADMQVSLVNDGPVTFLLET